MRMARPMAALAAALLLALPAGPALAQAAKPRPSGVTPPPADKASLDKAAYNLRLLLSAMQSDKIPAPVKNVLFACIYSNSLAKIGEAMDKAISASKQQVDRGNADQMIAVMAGVCGFRPQQAPAQAAPTKK